MPLNKETEIETKIQGKKTGVGWILWHINLCRLFNAKYIFMQIVSAISNNSV